LIRRIGDHLQRTREARDRKHLEKIETAALQATGVDPAQARQQAENMAAAMVDHAATARRSPETAGAAVDPQAAAEAKRARIKAMLAEARSGKFATKPNPMRFVTGPLGFFLGAKLRFFAGCALLTGCLLWLNQHGVFSVEEGGLAEAGGLGSVNLIGPSEPLQFPMVGVLFDSFNPGIAGLMLLLATCFRGWKMTLFVLPAAAIMVLGPKLGIPGVEVLGGSHSTSLVIGGVVAVVGLLFGRTREEFS
jgi:hypothetical protein